MTTTFPPLSTDVARRARLHTALRHLTPQTMGVPTAGLTDYTDEYFPMAVETLAYIHRDPIVHMQFFAKHAGIVAGTAEALSLVRAMLPPDIPVTAIEAWALADGDAVEARETMLTLSGPYSAIAAAETMVDGVLADRCLVATNAHCVTKAAQGKPVIFMGARHTIWSRQAGDGYAALVGGVAALSTRAGYAWVAPGTRPAGTMPHALIACMDGDVVAATLATVARLKAQHQSDVKVVSLVDYGNDCVTDAVRVALAIRRKYGEGALYGVRLDTSESMVDRSIVLSPTYGDEKPSGVTPELVKLVRAGLDAAGCTDVRIFVSGGFTARKIAWFEKLGVPVDCYGVGSSVLGHNAGEFDDMVSSFDATGDIVNVDGRDQHKAGRRKRDNQRLLKIDWTEGASEPTLALENL